MTSFNIDNGYFEGLVRGYRSGILRRNDYHNLVECETLDGMCLLYHLDYMVHSFIHSLYHLNFIISIVRRMYMVNATPFIPSLCPVQYIEPYNLYALHCTFYSVNDTSSHDVI